MRESRKIWPNLCYFTCMAYLKETIFFQLVHNNGNKNCNGEKKHKPGGEQL